MPTLAEKQRLFTAEEYHALGEAGILAEDDRVELIDGQIIAMSPIGSHHVAVVNRLNLLFVSRVGAAAITSVQNPVQLSDRSEPEPDVTLLRPRADFYANGLPGPEDVLLLVEVADATLAFDREVKLPRYAAAGIPEVWIVAPKEDQVDVYRRPGPDGYAERTVLGREDQATIEALPSIGSFDVDEMLG